MFLQGWGKSLQCNGKKKGSDLKFNLFTVRSEAKNYSTGFISQNMFIELCR